eukprot:m.973572 g.973572  ORF g.973572 m.973572 type:complete len:50 (+) comp23935_c3_seq3:273-422(+)
MDSVRERMKWAFQDMWDRTRGKMDRASVPVSRRSEIIERQQRVGFSMYN